MDTLPIITQNLTNLLHESWLSLLTEISKDFNIPLDELKTKYLSDSVLSSTKKRGRKKKIKDEYIETEEFEYKGITYLVDTNGIMYSNDAKNPVMVGVARRDGTIHLVNELCPV